MIDPHQMGKSQLPNRKALIYTVDKIVATRATGTG